MLTTTWTPSPRPLPPAKARKSSSLNFGRRAPPPPYTPSGSRPLDEMILDSPISVTARLMNSASKAEGIGLPGTPGLDDWMNEKSREELSGLLLKADGIIKSRETELSLTSALCKSLYSDNVTLKTKHEAFLARLPTTRGSTPTASRPASPLGQSPSYSAIAFPASPTGEPAAPLSVSRLRRARRISVTPAELALLSDQNAELLDKLESLEAESLKADQAGKRKLRRLEQEIQSLRDELDATQARGAELEEQAKAAAVQKRREEREARLQALKEKATVGSGSDVSEEIRDFAPPSSLSAARSSPVRRTVSGSSTSVETTSSSYSDSFERLALDDYAYEDVDFEVEEPPDAYFSALAAESGHDTSQPAEYAIISQLLVKIRELEETNAQIKDQQKATEERMRAAQWDAESIRRVYDCLDDGDVDLSIQEEDEQLPDVELTPSHGGTIRFSSLRRNIVGDMSRLMALDSDVFAQGISMEMQSTVRDGVRPKAHVSGKTRKSVVGLFDTDTDPDTSIESAVPRWGEYPPTLRVAPAFRHPDPGDISTWSSAATDGFAPPSPSPSTLKTPLDGPRSGRTLGSELGSEYGDDWAERGINHHLRTSSLVDLAGLYSSPASPSESISVLPPLAFPTVDDHQDEAGPSTPPRIPNLQLQPPTPQPDKARSPATVRQLRLSQTVRARTNRWVENRFPQSPPPDAPSGKTAAQAHRTRPSASTLGRRPAATDLLRRASGSVLADTFDSAVGQIRRVASRGSFAPLASAAPDPPPPAPAEHDSEVRRRARALEEDEGGEGDRSVSLRQDASAAGARQDGVVGFVLEAWLWLQFIIVIAVFLWSTAKRGPKVVLEAERRSAGRGAGRGP